MSTLEDAQRAAMDCECEVEVVEIAPGVHSEAPDEVIICANHGCDWREDEDIPCDERRKVYAAVEVGYRAAIEDAEVHARVSAYHYEGPLAVAWCNAASSIHSLLPTTDRTGQDR